jgi:glycosyltransferase involved in cell wall biosynthesis
MTKQNIAHISCQHALSGIGRYGIELTQRLKKQDLIEDWYKPYKTDHPDSYLHEQPWIKPIPYRSFRNLHNYVLPLYVSRAINWNKYDLVHSHWFLSGLASSVFGGKVKQIITMHDVSLLHIPEWNKTTTEYYRWSLERFKKKKTPIIVVSESARRDTLRFAKYPEELVHVVYNGIDHEQFNTEISVNGNRSKFRVIYSGGLGRRKNLKLLLDAFAEFKKYVQDSELLIAGAHPDRTPWPQYVIDQNIKDVRFTGFIPEDDVANFYRDADLMVFTSDYEGFGLAPLEAMACGTPVISTKGGSLSEVLGEAAILSESTASEIADKMKQVALNPKLQSHMSSAGLNWVKRYSWDRTAKETAELYRSLF